MSETPVMTPALRKRLRMLTRMHAGWYGLIAALGLTLIGVLVLGTVATEKSLYHVKQIQWWLPISLLVMFLCTLIHPRLIQRLTYPAGAVILLLLVLLILPFAPRALVPEINGATAWIDLGPMNFQPAEMAKILFVLALAHYLRDRSSYRTLKGLLVPFLIMFVPVGLILKQPDLGTALLFAPTLFAMLVAAGARLSHLSALAGVGLLAVSVQVAVIWVDPPRDEHRVEAVHLLAPHQEARIAAMIWPKRHQKGSGYQQHVATTIAGAGGLTGYGYERSRTLLRFNHLPEQHNDMIYAVILNRWGALGGLAVIGLYLVLLSSFTLVAARSKNPFARLACAGFAGMVFAQASINIAVTIGLLPITGLTLPFVSYGGSSLVSTFMMVGLVMNFASRRPVPFSRPSFEFDRPDPAMP